MFQSTPPTIDTTRPRLRQIAHWIRDELDPVIAREGPDHLRPNDVLILHDTFQALRTSSGITALDLRATGIHKAVMEISGMATRWPGRLCDDCDKIINVWRAKFGRLEDLRPFVYGRGGRLEGIASVEESTKQALVKRWQNHCPERICPGRSHRHGNLGFRAGDWWIDPLFAWHAGILDLDSVDGGICFDKHGAYAMLLRGTGEIEAPAHSNFTYRCGQNDKGRFRLTAATVKSRNPIRVLRSHSINSIWGPKAGVRYEGLYNVVGWSVHQMKTADISGDGHRVGDIVYDVHFVRDDPVPIEEVIKVPTASQVDEYTEYKRLRKLYREQERRGELDFASKLEIGLVSAKAAPPIPPLVPTIPYSKIQPTASQAASRIATFKKLSSKFSSAQTQAIGLLDHTYEDCELLEPAKTLGVPGAPSRTMTQLSSSESPISESRSGPLTLPTQTSKTSSNQSHNSDIKEVAPWVETELGLYAQAGNPTSTSANEVVSKISQSSAQSVKSAGTNPSAGKSPLRKRKSSEKSRRHLLHLASSGRDARPKGGHNPISKRSQNPMAKLFDGTKDGLDGGDDYFSYKSRPHSETAKEASPMAKERRRASSLDEIHLSPPPLGPISPGSPLLTERRGVLCLPYGYVLFPTPSTPKNETKPSTRTRASTAHPIDGMSSMHWVSSLPVSLQNFISTVKPTSALTTPASSPRRNSTSANAEVARNVTALGGWKPSMETTEARVLFKNPFEHQTRKDGVPTRRRKSSDGIAPDVVKRESASCEEAD